MDTAASFDPWNPERYEIKQRVLTIARSYEIWDDTGSLIGICDDPGPGRPEVLQVITDDRAKTPLLKIARVECHFPGDSEKAAYFAVTDMRSGEDVGRIKMLAGKTGNGIAVFLGAGAREIARLKHRSAIGSGVSRLLGGRKGASLHYRLAHDNTDLGEISRTRGEMGDSLHVKIVPAGGNRSLSKLSVATALLLDILRN